MAPFPRPTPWKLTGPLPIAAPPSFTPGGHGKSPSGIPAAVQPRWIASFGAAVLFLSLIPQPIAAQQVTDRD